MTREETISILAAIQQSTEVGASILFPHLFYRDFDPIHKAIFDLIDKKPGDPGYKPQKVIAAPRGLGKTTIANLVVPAISLLTARRRYIMPVSASFTLAQEHSDDLRNELLTNPLITELYGDVRTNIWSKDSFVAKIGSNDIMVRPRGAGQQVRGLKFRGRRPDLIIVDDLEDPEEMDTQEQRAKKKKWFYADLLNTVDRGAKDFEVIVVGTILHHDSLLVNLLENEDWDSVVLELCDDEFHSNAPNYMSDDEVRELYEQYKRSNELDVFYREQRNNPSAGGEDAVFQPRFFADNGYNEAEANLNTKRSVETVVLVDPSRTAKMNSAPSGIVVLGVDMNNNTLYVRECVWGRIHPEELYAEIGRCIKQFNASVLGVEVTGLHEFIVHPLKTFLSRQGLYGFEFVELQARGGKDEKGKTARVRTLVDYYRQGLIKHNKLVTQRLEDQLLAFPFSKDWSLMDPMGYITELLESGERYLMPFGSLGRNVEEDNKKFIDQEFEEILDDYEPWERKPLSGFRVV